MSNVIYLPPRATAAPSIVHAPYQPSRRDPQPRPAMTRKGFEMIAAVVRQAKVSAKARRIVARHFADALESTNEGFKRDKFLAACDPDKGYSPRSRQTDKSAFSSKSKR